MEEIKLLLNMKLRDYNVTLGEEEFESLWANLERNLEVWHKNKTDRDVSRAKKEGYDDGYERGYDCANRTNPSDFYSDPARFILFSFVFPFCVGLLVSMLLQSLLR